VRLFPLVLAPLLITGCSLVTPRGRTLPDRIQTIYLAMPRNDSYEYGFEEGLARHLHEEFMSDGRVRVVGAPRADARLDTTIRSFTSSVRSFNSDDYPFLEQATISVGLKLWEPGREQPTLDLGNVSADVFYVADPRRSVFTPEPEWHDQLMKALALRIVDEVLSHRAGDQETEQPFQELPEEVDLDLSRSSRDLPTVRPSPGTY
jgi:hypothetical protein